MIQNILILTIFILALLYWQLRRRVYTVEKKLGGIHKATKKELEEKIAWEEYYKTLTREQRIAHFMSL